MDYRNLSKMTGKKIGINFAISALSRVIGFFISYFITLRLITGYLKEEGFGQYSTAFAFTYFFSFLADLGLYSLMTRDISRPQADEKKVATDIFSLRLFSITVSLLIAVIVMFFLPYKNEVKIAILLSTLFYFFSSLSQVISGIFQKYLKVWHMSIAEILSRVIGLAAVWGAIIFNLGLLGIVFATSLAAFVNFLFVFPLARNLIPFSFSLDFTSFRNIFKKTWPIGLSIVFTVVYFKIDTILLSFFKSYHEVGIYNLSYKLFEGLIFFPAMFVGLIMPILSKFALQNKKKFIEYFQKSLHLILVVALPLIIILFTKPLYVVQFFGSNFAKQSLNDAAIVFQMLLGAFFFVALGSLLSNALIALEKQKYLLIAYFFGMIFNIILNLIFIPKFGYFAAGATTLATESLVTLLLLIFLIKDVQLSVYFFDRLRVIIPSIILVLFNAFLPTEISIVYFLFLSALVYFIALYLSRGLTQKDLDFDEKI